MFLYTGNFLREKIYQAHAQLQCSRSGVWEPENEVNLGIVSRDNARVWSHASSLGKATGNYAITMVTKDANQYLSPC